MDSKDHTVSYLAGGKAVVALRRRWKSLLCAVFPLYLLRGLWPDYSQSIGPNLNTLEKLQLLGDKKGTQINDSNTANDNNIFDIQLQYDIT
jgi:hypothetical protein